MASSEWSGTNRANIDGTKNLFLGVTSVLIISWRAELTKSVDNGTEIFTLL